MAFTHEVYMARMGMSVVASTTFKSEVPDFFSKLTFHINRTFKT